MTDSHEALVEKVGLKMANHDRLNAGLGDVLYLSKLDGAEVYRVRARIALSVVAEALSKPTEEMVDTAEEEMQEARQVGYGVFAADVYRTMLSVSPLYPKKDGGNA